MFYGLGVAVTPGGDGAAPPPPQAPGAPSRQARGGRFPGQLEPRALPSGRPAELGGRHVYPGEGVGRAQVGGLRSVRAGAR